MRDDEALSKNPGSFGPWERAPAGLLYGATGPDDRHLARLWPDFMAAKLGPPAETDSLLK